MNLNNINYILLSYVCFVYENGLIDSKRMFGLEMMILENNDAWLGLENLISTK